MASHSVCPWWRSKKMRVNTVDISLLRSAVIYDPETGLFTWRARPANPQWTGRYAGRPAFAAPHNQGYLKGSLGGVSLLAHRAAWALYYGDWPKDQIDHINGVRSDNRIVNLRDVTHKENHKNCRPWQSKKSKLLPGVFANHGKFSSRIRVNRKTYHLGTFNSEEEAHQAYQNAKSRFGFHPNHAKKHNRIAPLIKEASV